MADRALHAPAFPSRLLAYLSERFPPLPYALALGAFTFATLAYAHAAAQAPAFTDPYAAFVAFAVTLLAFLQLRIHDEFKDFADDSLYRPERPVQRGLVTLKELAWVGAAATGMQLALSATLGLRALGMLAAILGYSWLMRVEFFARDWLRKHAVAYLASHMLIVPLVALYIVACSGTAPDAAALAPYLAFGYFNFSVFEIGRKLWAPEEERRGVETYSALWGRPRAVLAWLAVIASCAGSGALAAGRISAGLLFGIAALTVGLLALGVAGLFLLRPGRVKKAGMSAMSALWFLASTVAFGAAALQAA